MDESDFEEIMRIQRMTASRIREEQETENKIKIMDIINDLTTGKKAVVQREAAIIEATMQGLSEKEADRIIDELVRDNFIIEKEGYLKKV